MQAKYNFYIDKIRSDVKLKASIVPELQQLQQLMW